MKDNKQIMQALKFTLFSVSAGVIQIASFAILEIFIKTYWIPYLTSLVLSILWAAIEIMHRVIVGKEKKPEAAKTEPTVASAPAVSSDDAAVAPAHAASEDDGALVAAITAAIIAARADEGCTGGFRVVSFKRTAGARKR